MSTPHVTVIVPPDLADGYRLAGVHTEQAVTAADAGEVLGRLMAGQRGVVAVYPPFLRELGARSRRLIARAEGVLVVALPEGVTPGEPARTGENLRDLLARAVGYEFTFDPAGGAR